MPRLAKTRTKRNHRNNRNETSETTWTAETKRATRKRPEKSLSSFNFRFNFRYLRFGGSARFISVLPVV
jgi:hypothetical protein